KPLKKLPVEIWNINNKIADVITDNRGRFSINAPATIDVRFNGPNNKKEQQWLFYEYTPLVDIIEDIYTIRWADKYPGIKGGQMPWEAFYYDEIKEILKVVNWTIRPTGKSFLPDL